MEVTLEEEAASKTETAQHIESSPEAIVASESQDCSMEETVSQLVVSEASASQPIPISLLRTIEETKADNAKVNECLDKQDLMFQLILSRIPPPPQNP